MHVVRAALSLLNICGYTVGRQETVSKCKGKPGLHVGARGDVGAGNEPIFILYLKRLEKKEKTFL